MARVTVAQLATRLDKLEESVPGELAKVNSRLDKLDFDVNNGMSDRIAAALVKHQEEQWQKERDTRLEEAETQLALNREYGEKRDADQTAQLRHLEIKTKLWSAVVPAVITAIGIVVVALFTGGGL